MDERESALERRRAAASLARHRVQRAFQLSVAVGGTIGGLLLLGSNVTVMLLAGVAPTSPVPYLANLALVFGGVMFAREFRRSGPVPRHRLTDIESTPRTGHGSVRDDHPGALA